MLARRFNNCTKNRGRDRNTGQYIKAGRFVIYPHYTDEYKTRLNVNVPNYYGHRGNAMQSEVFVLERCPHKRGHYHDVTFMTPLTVLSVQ